MAYDIFDLLAFLLVLTPIVLVHELGHFIAAIKNNIKVEEFGLGIPPRAAKLFTWRGTIFSLNWIPLGGFVRPAGEDDPNVEGGLASAPKKARFIVLVAGAAANFIFAFILFWLAFVGTEIPIYDDSQIALHGFTEGGVAINSGLQENDILVSINGIEATSIDMVIAEVQASPNQTVNFVVERAGETLEFDLVPADRDGKGIIGVGLGGFDTGEVLSYGVLGAAKASVSQIAEIITMTLRVPMMLIRGDVSVGEVGFVGPAGIAKGIRESAGASIETGQWYRFLAFVGFINVALGFTNLLPIPALDGGRILFVIIEAIRGRRVEPEREAVVHVMGMALLLGLMVLIFVNDFINPFDFNFR